METVAINGELRTGTGKKASKQDRKSEVVPCVLYGKDGVVHFTTTSAALKPLIYTGDFKLANIQVDGTDSQAIIKDVQFHPVTDEVLHVDFLKLIPNHPVKVEVPVRFKGTSPGVKLGGKLQQSLRRVKIKTTPEKLVDELKVDISTLDMGQSVRVRDLEVGENIEIMVEGATPIATIEIPRALRSAAAKAKTEA